MVHIPEKSPGLAYLEGVGPERVVSNESSDVEDFHNDIKEISKFQIEPDQALEILDKIRQKNVAKYNEMDENGEHYYVLTLENNEETESYFFDSKTYRLIKERFEKNTNSNDPSKKINRATIHYLQANYLPIDQSQRIFDPDQYDISPQQGFVIPSDNHAQGCYDPNGNKVSQQESEILWGSLSAKTKEEYNNLQSLLLNQPKGREIELKH